MRPPALRGRAGIIPLLVVIVPVQTTVRATHTSHLERKFVTLVDGSNLCRGERLWGMQV